MFSHLEYLENLFPGLAVIPATAAGRVIGFADQTTANKIHNKTFPIATHTIGVHRVVKKIDLARFLDELGQPEKPKRGAPTKASRLAAQAASEVMP